MAHRLELDAERLQHAGRDALALARDAEQEVLGADVTVAELTSLVDRELDDLLDPRREGDLARRRRRVATPDGELDRRTDLGELHAQRIEHPRRNALALAHESEEEMVGADVVVVEADRLILRERKYAFRAVVEAIEGSHRERAYGVLVR